MLTISKPLSAGQAQAYHKEEFANAQGNYYSEGDRIRGEWHGKLAEEWGLHGDVQEEHFPRLAKASIRSPASNWCAIRRRANTPTSGASRCIRWSTARDGMPRSQRRRAYR